MPGDPPRQGDGQRRCDQGAEQGAGDHHQRSAAMDQYGGRGDRDNRDIGRIPTPRNPLPAPDHHTNGRRQGLGREHRQQQVRTIDRSGRVEPVGQQYPQQQSQARPFVTEKRRFGKIGEYPAHAPDQPVIPRFRRRRWCSGRRRLGFHQRRPTPTERKGDHAAESHPQHIADHRRQVQRVTDKVDQ